MSQWKQLQSGVRKIEMLNKISVLFVKSNFWQRGDNLELYDDNDAKYNLDSYRNQAPMSRLSSVIQQNIEDLNIAIMVILLYEKK